MKIKAILETTEHFKKEIFIPYIKTTISVPISQIVNAEITYDKYDSILSHDTGYKGTVEFVFCKFLNKSKTKALFKQI